VTFYAMLVASDCQGLGFLNLSSNFIDLKSAFAKIYVL